MRKIGIIAGHNGAMTGAHGVFDEGTETITMRNMVIDIIGRDIDNVYVDGDTMSLSAVVASVNAALSSNDYCVDIHFNASGNNGAHGCECVIADAAGLETMKFATALVDAVSDAGGFFNRHVIREVATPRKQLAMCRQTRPHTAILEICFCTNREDANRYNTNKYKIANAIAAVLNQYRNK